MKTKLNLGFILLFTQSFLSFAQTNTPPIELEEKIYGGFEKGAYFLPVSGVNSFYALKSSISSLYSSSEIAKIGKNGWTHSICNNRVGCTDRNAMLFASQDDGVLLVNGRELSYFDTNGKFKAAKNANTGILKVSATLTNGFHFWDASNTISRNNAKLLVEWSLKIENFDVKDIKTSSDDGLVITGDNGTRKYNSSGTLQWNIQAGGREILIIDPTNMYIVANQTITKYNVTNGTLIWNKTFENIIDAKITNDKGIAILTKSNLSKLTTNGDQSWQNTDFADAKQIIASGDAAISVLKENIVTKISNSNKLIWRKEIDKNYNMNGTALNIYGAADNGVFVTGRFYEDFSTHGVLLKIAANDSTCNFKPIIPIYQDAEYCVNPSFTLSGRLEGSSSSTDAILQWQKDGKDILNANQTTLGNLTTGSYTLKVTRGKCVAVSEPAKIRIAENNQQPKITSDQSAVCLGTPVMLSASGCSGRVHWRGGATGSSLTISIGYQNIYASCELNYSDAGVNKTCLSVPSFHSIQSKNSGIIGYLNTTGVICSNDKWGFIGFYFYGDIAWGPKWLKDGKEVNQGYTINPTEEGAYNARFTDSNGCQYTTNTVNLKKSEVSSPNLSIEGSKDFCEGSTTTLISKVSNETEKYFYEWKKDGVEIGKEKELIVKNEGVYTVAVKDVNNCTYTSNPTTIIEKVKGLTANISLTGSNTIYEPDSVTLNATTGNSYGYQWKKDGTNIAGASIPIYKAKKSGSYEVVVSKDGCSKTSAAIQIIVNPLLSVEPDDFGVNIYPNPASDVLMVELPSGLDFKEVIIYDKSGKLINRTNDKHLKISDLQRGNYILKIRTSKGNINKNILLE